MHKVIVNHIINLLSTELDPNIRIYLHAIKEILTSSDTEILGPISLSYALKASKLIPNLVITPAFVRSISAAIKKAEREGSSLNCDIALIMSQTNTNYDTARKALLKNNGDVVNAIMELTDYPHPKIVYGENLPNSPFENANDSISEISCEDLPALEDIHAKPETFSDKPNPNIWSSTSWNFIDILNPLYSQYRYSS